MLSATAEIVSLKYLLWRLRSHMKNNLYTTAICLSNLLENPAQHTQRVNKQELDCSLIKYPSISEISYQNLHNFRNVRSMELQSLSSKSELQSKLLN